MLNYCGTIEKSVIDLTAYGHWMDGFMVCVLPIWICMYVIFQYMIFE